MPAAWQNDLNGCCQLNRSCTLLIRPTVLQDFDWDSSQDVELDVSIIPGEPWLLSCQRVHVQVHPDIGTSTFTLLVQHHPLQLGCVRAAEKTKFLPNFMSKAISKATSFRCGVENFEMFGACPAAACGQLPHLLQTLHVSCRCASSDTLFMRPSEQPHDLGHLVTWRLQATS